MKIIHSEIKDFTIENEVKYFNDCTTGVSHPVSSALIKIEVITHSGVKLSFLCIKPKCAKKAIKSTDHQIELKEGVWWNVNEL